MMLRDDHFGSCDADKDHQLSGFYCYVLEQALAYLSTAEAGSILVLQNDRYHFIAAQGFNLAELQTITLHLDELLLSKHPATARSFYLLHDFDKYNLEHLDNYRQRVLGSAGRVHEIRESLVLPVRIRQVIKTILCLDVFTQGRSFSRSEIAAAEMFRDVLRLALRCDDKEKVRVLNTLLTQSRAMQNVSLTPLTARQEQILRLIAFGMSDKDIAKQLNVAHCTARNQVTELLSKLGVKNRTQAAIWAVKFGLVDLPTEL